MEQSRTGRPRTFDADAALEKALLAFWEHGYEGATLAVLTESMGISRKSMYAAFGNKEELFLKAFERYDEGPGSYVHDSMSAISARGVAESFLDGAVIACTQPGRPAGCLGVRAALAVGVAGQTVQKVLVSWRAKRQVDLRNRFERAVDENDLPADADIEMIARYLTTMADGLSVQATEGATRESLQQVVAAALLHWPPAQGQRTQNGQTNGT